MNSLEYLSGFSIGHIIRKSLDDLTTDIITIENYLIDNYSTLWELFHDNIDFQVGFELGINLDRFPQLRSNIGYWFHTLINSSTQISFPLVAKI